MAMVMYRRDANPIIYTYKIKIEPQNTSMLFATSAVAFLTYSMKLFDSSCYSRVMRGGGVTTSDLGTRAWQMPCLHISHWPTARSPRNGEDVPGLSVAA